MAQLNRINNARDVNCVWVRGCVVLQYAQLPRVCWAATAMGTAPLLISAEADKHNDAIRI